MRGAEVEDGVVGERERHTGRNIAYLDFGIPTVGFFTLVP
jgi:hypothetical protein